MSDDESNTAPRKNITFTIDERKLLLKLVNLHYDVVSNKKVDSASTTLKNQAWEAINKEYMEHTSLVRFPRTVQQLKRCWENMKCKAKKGDPVSVKLLRWGENQYRLTHNGGNQESFQDDSESDAKDGDNFYEPNVKLEESNSVTDHTTVEDIFKMSEAESSNCVHCSCDKSERNARLQLIALQKQQSEELHILKMAMQKDKIKRERQLYKLAVHEMTLRVENERRRAEILEKELGS